MFYSDNFAKIQQVLVAESTCRPQTRTLTFLWCNPGSEFLRFISVQLVTVRNPIDHRIQSNFRHISEYDQGMRSVVIDVCYVKDR